MTEQELLNGLMRILRDLLSDDSIVLTMETKRDEVANWDSFAYVNFIVAVEMNYDVKFGVAEVESFQNVGALVRRIAAILLSRQQRLISRSDLADAV
jgi:acyl carrier protein